MDFEGLVGILVFIAIIGFNIIVPIIKGLKENKEVEIAHEKKMRERRPHGEKPASARHQMEEKRNFDRSARHPARKSGDSPLKKLLDPEALLREFMPQPPPERRRQEPLHAHRKSSKKQVRKETQDEMLERLVRQNAEANRLKREAGEICDECYDEHSEQSKYASFLKQPDALAQAVVISEIFGKPLSLRGDGGVFDSKF